MNNDTLPSTDLSRIHAPVLLEECVKLVTGSILSHPSKHAIIVDCTLGLAGHAIAFLKAAPNAVLIGIDRDEQALVLASQRVNQEGLAQRFIPVHAAFDEVDRVLDELHIDTIDAAFMDLGLSSLQIDETERGFSYAHDSALDMRMDVSQTLTAAHILATYDAYELTSIFREYGEERFASAIARRIVAVRDNDPLVTSGQLVRLVDQVIPKAHRAAGNPAKRVFQALRIEVNGELDKLARTLPKLTLHLAKNGRLVVESYHSLEDTAVKRFMNQGLTIDVPANMPVIPDEAQPFFNALTHGALKASEEEIEQNSRSASVRLRAVELLRDIPERWLTRLHEQTMPVHRTTQRALRDMRARAVDRKHSVSKRRRRL